MLPYTDMRGSLQPDRKDIEEQAATQNGRRKRGSDSEDDNNVSKKEAPERPLAVFHKSRLVATRNFFAPLRGIPMESARPGNEGSSSTAHTKESPDKGTSPP
jgi:hypothetical protein